MKNETSSLKQVVFAMVLFVLVAGFSGCEDVKNAVSGSCCGGKSEASSSSGKHGYSSPFNAKDGDSSEVLAEFNDGSKITMNVIDGYIDTMLKNMPQQMDRAAISDKDKQDILDGIMRVKLIELGFGDGVLGSADFQTKLSEVMAAESQKLLFNMFLEKAQGTMSVSQKDVRKEYEDNREKYLKQQGGVLLGATEFEDAVSANSFVKLAKSGSVATVKGMDELATAKGVGAFRSFGRVSEKMTRGAPDAVVEAALDLSLFPAVNLVSVEGEGHWVYVAEDLTEDVYLSFEEAAPMISETLQHRGLEEKISEVVKGYEKKWLKKANKGALAAAAA